MQAPVIFGQIVDGVHVEDSADHHFSSFGSSDPARINEDHIKYTLRIRVVHPVHLTLVTHWIVTRFPSAILSELVPLLHSNPRPKKEVAYTR